MNIQPSKPRTMALWLRLCVVLLVSNGCLGHSTGAGPEACKDLMPRHASTPAQTTAPPFKITVSATTYTSGQAITVTLATPCSRSFKGFLIQARNAEDVASDPIGSFNTPAGTRALTGTGCGTGTQSVTHASSAVKNTITLTWTAPAAPTTHIVFVATFVESYSTIYKMIYSPAVSLTGNPTLVPPSGVVMPTVDNCPPATTTAPTGSLTQDPECGTSKSCFVDCPDGTCSFVVSWQTTGDNIEFILKGGVSGSDDQWIALGFSQDSTMGDDTVIDCAVSGSTKVARHSANNGKQNNVVATLPSTSVELVDNVLSCTLTIAKTNAIFTPTTPYTLLFAKGATVAGSTTKSKHTTAPQTTSETADLTSNTQVLGAVASSAILAKVHGSLMVTAWVLLASFGLVVARYYKKLGGSRKWCNNQIWFVLHRVSMVTVFLLAVIAFIIIFVDVKGYSQVGKSANELKFLQAHPILGIISTALVVLNPIMAVFRPDHGTSKRPIFNWAHWAVGTTAWIVSIVTIFIGFEIPKSGVHKYTIYVMAAFVAYQLIIEIILEVHGCMQQKSTKAATNEYEMKHANGKPSESIPSGSSSGSGVFRSVILVAHAVILFAFLVALLYMINVDGLKA